MLMKYEVLKSDKARCLARMSLLRRGLHLRPADACTNISRNVTIQLRAMTGAAVPTTTLALCPELTPTRRVCGATSSTTTGTSRGHERRHIVVAACDSRREFNAYLKAELEAIQRRTATGEHVDPSERISETSRARLPSVRG